MSEFVWRSGVRSVIGGRARTVVRLGLLVVLVAVGLLVALSAAGSSGRADRLARQADTVQASANGLLVDLLNAETGQRGFLLTGRPAYLQPYTLGVGAVPGDLRALAAASAFDPALASQARELRALTAAKLAFMAETVALASAGRHAAALGLVDTNVGQQTMDLVRGRIAAVDRRASGLALPARAQADDAQTRALIVDGLLVVLALGLGAWWWLASRRSRFESDRAFGILAVEARVERALREIATASAGGIEERALAALVAARISGLLNAEGAAVLRAEEECLRVIGSSGPDPFPERVQWDEDSASVRAVRSGGRARVESYSQAGGDASAFVRAQGVRCAISAPVQIEGRVWGCVSLITAREGGFSGEDERLLERFAALASAALGQAQSQARLREEARFERALREVAAASASGEADERALARLVASRIAELLDAPAASVVRFGDGEMTMVGSGGPDGLAVGATVDEGSVARLVARSGTTVVLDAHAPQLVGHREKVDRTGSCSVLAVPLRVAGRLWGSLGAMLREEAAVPKAVALLERFAGLTAAALANTQAQARLGEEARLEAMLQRVSAAALAPEVDERHVAQLVADAVAELLGASFAAVARRDGAWMTVLGNHGWRIPERVPVGGSVSAKVIAAGRPVRVKQYAELGGEVVAQVLAEQDIGAVVGVPVRLHGDVWGTLLAASTPRETLEASAERWLERFAALIAAVIAAAQASARVREQAAVLGSLSDGLVIFDAAGVILEVNEPLCAMTGYSAGELVGCGAPYPFSTQEAAVDLAAGEDRGGEWLLRRKGGALVRVVVSLSSVPDARGMAARHAAVVKDVSESVLRARVERAMRRIASAAAGGMLDERALADLAASEIAVLLDNPLAAIIRFDGPERMSVIGHAGDFPYPTALDADDDATVSAIVARTGASARIDDYAALDGSFAHLATDHGVRGAVAVPIRLDGRLWGALGSMTDRPGGFIAETEALLERCAEVVALALASVRSHRALLREARLEKALREISTASASGELDAPGLFDLVAARVCDILDAPAALITRAEEQRSVLVGTHGLDSLPDTLTLGERAAVTIAWRSGRPARVGDYAEIEDATRPGETGYTWGYRSVVAAPVFLHQRTWGSIAAAHPQPHYFDADSETILERFAELVALALAQADALAALQQQATTDGLTGLLNHRAFQTRLHHEFARAQRHDRPLSLIMFDLDSFKLVNDIHGHQAGDRVLHAIGQTLAREGRAGDITARVGGDEFALIAPETTAQDALALAERLRAAAATAVEELDLPVTISAGVTDLTLASTTHDLFHLADSALYHAKHHGRDRTVRYTPDEASQPTVALPSRRARAHTALASLVRAVDAKDSPTQRHAERVATIATHIAARDGWSPARCARLREAALLHDVGKLGIPDNILNKSGPLTDAEYEIVKTHAALGAHIAEGLLDPEQVTWVRGHHERPDGNGYPDALTHPNIPDGALLLAVADAYDSMTAARPYRDAKTSAEALTEMRRHARTQFDPHLLKILHEWIAANTNEHSNIERPERSEHHPENDEELDRSAVDG